MRHNEQGLFPALEAALKAASEPLDCQDLFDMPEIRKHAASANRVSDYLGGLWRKGLVVRLPAPKMENSRSRWMYQWKSNKSAAEHRDWPQPGIVYAPRVVADRPSVLITEEGSTMTLEFKNLLIVIKQK